MSNFEKGMMVSLVLVLALSVAILVTGIVNLNNAIDEAGGVKAVIIEAGKEIKEISEEIAKE